MEIIMEVINAFGAKIIGLFVAALFSAVAMGLKTLCTKYINTEIKQNLAKTAVQAVEQVYKDIHGEEKLNKAMEYLSATLNEYGITISTTEMKVLLEAAVGEFNKVFEAN